MPHPTPRSSQPPFAQPVSVLAGVGFERAGQLARLDIHTVEDLILHRPRRYEDRRQCVPVATLSVNEPATSRGRVVAKGIRRFRHGTKSVFELILDDGSARLHCRWWNLPFMEKYFEFGDEVFVFGKLSGSKSRTMEHPETETVVTDSENFVHLNRIVPIYPLTEGLPQRWLRGLMWRTLDRFGSRISDPWPALDGQHVISRATDPASKSSALSRAEAIRIIHFPATLGDAEFARRRLALDEFIGMQRDIRARRIRFQARAKAMPCAGDNRLIRPFLAKLGFSLTSSQTEVLREIRKDLGGTHPMRRLLQGDVGSGKTVVAACAALMSLESGYDVAIMAPTEILAEQHFRNFDKWFAPLGIRINFITGSRKTASSSGQDSHATEPDLLQLRTAEPKMPVLSIGTHALIESNVGFPRLGLVIIDEQHRFGVAQRELLVRKGEFPHLLVMTATPIPRTLGLTIYGDLDISVIRESPPGRGRLQTFVRDTRQLTKVWEFIRTKLGEGRQAFIVYPRIDETEGDLKAAAKEFENVKKALAPFRVAMLHGRVRADERDRLMASFRINEISALVATSLIEVGVDVPNATMMVIENADRFGLAQLHQLRGRIGRGGHESYCILVAGEASEDARRRLEILAETTDGFRVAEADLQLRGPGELLGQQQSGVPDFQFGDLRKDLDLIQTARTMASRLVDDQR